mgnify:CR=1 FL=1
MRAALGMLLLASCAHGTIENSDIKDTEENRAIVAAVQDYKDAMESLDADAVLSLLSESYYEDNANISENDDYDYAQLQQKLHAEFDRTEVLKLTIRVDAVEVEDSTAWAEVYYDLRARLSYPSGIKWETASDRTRLRFKYEQERWKLVSGL